MGLHTHHPICSWGTAKTILFPRKSDIRLRGDNFTPPLLATYESLVEDAAKDVLQLDAVETNAKIRDAITGRVKTFFKDHVVVLFDEFIQRTETSMAEFLKPNLKAVEEQKTSATPTEQRFREIFKTYEAKSQVQYPSLVEGCALRFDKMVPELAMGVLVPFWDRYLKFTQIKTGFVDPVTKDHRLLWSHDMKVKAVYTELLRCETQGEKAIHLLGSLLNARQRAPGVHD